MTRELTAARFEEMKGICPSCGTALERTSARTVIRNGDTPDAPTKLVLVNTFGCMANLRTQKRCGNADRYVVETELEFESE